jgi:hypothetical protein
MKPVLKVPKTKRLKLKYDELPPSFAFKFNMRRYTQYAAFALPQIQLTTSSPGFATGEIQAGRCRLALSNPR